MPSETSTTEVTLENLLERCRDGDDEAASRLFAEYSKRLLTIVERELGKDLKQRLDPEDITQTVFRTFFRRNSAGLIRIVHRTPLWRLFVTITLNKVRRKARDARAARRDPTAEAGQDASENVLAATASLEPTPEQAAILKELLEHAVDGLDDSEAAMLRMCLEGYSTTEIAAETGVSRWTVRRVLDWIGTQLEESIEPETANR